MNTEQAEQWQQQLAAGLTAMSLTLAESQQQLLIQYLELLSKWNKTYNLTAIRDPDVMVSRQLLDSLSILPRVKGPRILDVGTGAGLPGIPLAISLPNCEFVLLDSNGKKTRFIQQAITELRLQNIRVENVRVETFNGGEGFDTITSRAFADIHLMLELTQHLHKLGGQWLAMKASLDELESKPLPSGLSYQFQALDVPGESAQRHMVIVETTSNHN